MERDFLAAIGKEQQHPQQEKPGREGSGTLPGLLPPRCRAGFLDLRPHRHRAVRGFLPCFLIGFVAALPARRDAAWVGALRTKSRRLLFFFFFRKKSRRQRVWVARGVAAEFLLTAGLPCMLDSGGS